MLEVNQASGKEVMVDLTLKSGSRPQLTRMTSAPRDAKVVPITGPAMIRTSSTTLIPARGRSSADIGRGTTGVGTAYVCCL